jgi:hypothetical protein
MDKSSLDKSTNKLSIGLSSCKRVDFNCHIRNEHVPLYTNYNVVLLSKYLLFMGVGALGWVYVYVDISKFEILPCIKKARDVK